MTPGRSTWVFPRLEVIKGDRLPIKLYLEDEKQAVLRSRFRSPRNMIERRVEGLVLVHMGVGHGPALDQINW